MLVKGDKIKLVKPMGVFTNVGEICEVVDVTKEGVVSFRFGKVHMGCMSIDEFNKYFVKYEDPKPVAVTPERIEQVMNESKVVVRTLFDKCTVVACKLPSGFVIVESSACVDPKNYDEKMGVEICMNRIKDKVWELEGYRLQQKIYDDNIYTYHNHHECTCEEDCNECHNSKFCPYHCDDNCNSCERNK